MKYIYLAVLSLFAFHIQAMDFHVSLNGSDDNNGSESDPWRSIQYAMEEATPGSTIFIHEGMYNEPLYLEVSGDEGSEIIFTNYGEEEVIIDGSNFTSTSILEVYNKSHVTIKGIIFQNFERNDAIGILIEGKCAGISVIDCTIRNINFSSDPNAAVNENTNAQPLIVYGTEADQAIEKLTISGNKIHDCRTGYSEALAINGNVDGFLVDNNEVFNISNIGIDIIGHEGTCNDPSVDQARNGIIKCNKTYNCKSPYATSAGIYVDGGASLIIESNEVYDNQWGIEIGCENVGKSASDIIVRNNVIYSNQTAGLQLGGYDFPSGSGKVINTQIVNNTIYGNDIESDGTGEIYLSYNENLRVYNNVIAANNSDGTILSTEDLSVESLSVTIRNNNWFNFVDGNSGFFYYNGKDYDDLLAIESSESSFSDNIHSNPNFKSMDDFHLLASSPMINAGYSNADADYGDKDFDGDMRLIGEKVDIGADEFDGVVSAIIDKKFEVNFSIFPNPATEFILISSHNIVLDEVKIYDLIGRLMLSSKTINEAIDVSNFRAGKYLVNVINEGKIIGVRKLVIFEP